MGTVSHFISIPCAELQASGSGRRLSSIQTVLCISRICVTLQALASENAKAAQAALETLMLFATTMQAVWDAKRAAQETRQESSQAQASPAQTEPMQVDGEATQQAAPPASHASNTGVLGSLKVVLPVFCLVLLSEATTQAKTGNMAATYVTWCIVHGLNSRLLCRLQMPVVPNFMSFRLRSLCSMSLVLSGRYVLLDRRHSLCCIQSTSASSL